MRARKMRRVIKCYCVSTRAEKSTLVWHSQAIEVALAWRYGSNLVYIYIYVYKYIQYVATQANKNSLPFIHVITLHSINIPDPGTQQSYIRCVIHYLTEEATKILEQALPICQEEELTVNLMNAFILQWAFSLSGSLLCQGMKPPQDVTLSIAASYLCSSLSLS